MTQIKDQIPSGGCDNCGGPVRTRKSHGWVCAQCEYDLSHAERLTSGYYAGSEPRRAQIMDNWGASAGLERKL